ncbi:MAG: complex I NDUFA9 subunit family protein [Propionivibrio sp.]|uniref:Complex I NDUFA9 subunit family protein n=1 Tax=Candidatus Propionivibrio dominans TaxID=2954373 RepID=A0A9D7FDG7_9RHOO|nr:complex I NDUFA9 subunit family protein [Candidatus Propionivibrio dominans]
MELKKVLLIGGSGFVGGWIANRLSERGIRVNIPTRRRDNTKQLILLPTVYMVDADVHDPQVLVSLMTGVDAVINLVGILHDGDSRKPYGKRFAAAHVELPKKILAAMMQTGVRRLVHMSALRASEDAPSAYLRSKAAGEAAVLGAASELDVTVFRPSVIFGPGDAFLNTFASLLRVFPVMPLGGADARFQPVYIGDVADAFCASLTDRATFGQTYELCGPTVYTLRELVEYTGELIGRRRPVIGLPDSLAYLQAGFLSLLPNPPMSPDNLRSMQLDNLTDGSHNYPGWQPQSLEAVAPGYLSALRPNLRLDKYRCRAGR